MLDEGRYCGSPELFIISTVAGAIIYGCCRLSYQTMTIIVFRYVTGV